MRVRRAGPDDVPAMARVLAAAFAGDPPLRWLTPDRGREARLKRYFAGVLPVYLRHGAAWACDAPAGAAAWIAPGAWPLPAGASARLLPAALATFWPRPVRTVRATRAVTAGHPAEPHWYLDFIGVDPAAHRRGAGSALLAAGLAVVDARGDAAYLNAGSPRSRDLYARHGFAVIERFALPGGGPPLWRMWREPVRQGARSGVAPGA